MRTTSLSKLALMALGAAGLAAVITAIAARGAVAAPLPPSAVPEPLKTWIPWVMHGQESVACPAPYNGDDSRACVWPSRLEMTVTDRGADFKLTVQVFGAAAMVALPGEVGRWPQDLKADGRVLVAAARNERPVASLPAGAHVVTGALRWAEMPQDLLLPAEAGSLQLIVNGKPVDRAPDAEGRVWLRQAPTEEQATDALTVRTTRLVEDDIPMRVTTRYDIAIAGKPREIQLPAALLAGFVPESLASQLPARLQESGALRLQGRPGNWTVEVRARLMQPTATLQLPADLADEVWSFAARNELRVVTVEGLTAVDPKQVSIPDAWRAFPAFQMKAQQVFKLVESRRGNPQPGADQLSLAREIWLDFDGSGYTLQDRIQGRLSRSWRLEMAAPGVLGRAAVDGADLPVTRREGAALDGIELRRGTLALNAVSRIEGDDRKLPATGWTADFQGASSLLHLPPGWRLLHAGGVDVAEGAWLARWTLWDFFFVLLCTLGAGKLLGLRVGLLVAAALVLTWHMPDAPQGPWIALIALVALTRVLPDGKLLRVASGGAWGCAGLIALWLVPYAVEQVRLSVYPSLEAEGAQFASGSFAGGAAPVAATAATPAPAPAPAAEADASEAAGAVANKPMAPPALMQERRSAAKVDELRRMATPSQSAAPAGAGSRIGAALYELDPSVKVQTGPGLPVWHWNSHRLIWQGPVKSEQRIHFYLLPPAGTAALRLGGLVLMIGALCMLAAGLPGWGRRPRLGAAGTAAGTAGAMLLAGLTVLGLTGLPDEARAATAAKVAAPASPEGSTPDNDVLEALRAKLTAPPDCQPQCADVARLRIEAQGARLQLRLEVHALADTAIPLPGQGANWRPATILVDGKPAIVRRDGAGVLWLALRAGVSQVLLATDFAEGGNNVEIALPMPPREVSMAADGWTLAGLDPRGVASGALILSRTVARTRTPDGSGANGGSNDDVLPAFLRIERIVRLGLRWTVETRISRLAPSRAPVRARIRLLEGEAVNSGVVRVEEGHALVQLGAEDAASFVSTLKESARLQLVSAKEPNQIEQWRLEPSAQWHVEWSGIAPVQYTDGDGGRLAPAWQPWPGETVALQVGKPGGTPGQTLTIDGVNLRVSPGQRATDVSSTATLRTSQGSNHRIQLPEGVEFLGLAIDGRSQPITPQGRELLIPITPGTHRLKIDWREPRGIGWRFETSPHGLGAAGVNARTEIVMPPERVVLALGGPRVGPAVLFWGVLVAMGAVAIGLARSRLTPLGAAAWFLLGIGLAQTSLFGAAVVVGWFFVLAARRRLVAARSGEGTPMSRWLANIGQVLLVLWTIVAAAFLLNAVRVGLLGYPDMMVLGNGSGAANLRWYQDRFADQLAPAWVVSVPVLAYRLLMLLWAFWLAAALLRWVRWGWESFSVGGYWHKAPPKAPVNAPVNTPVIVPAEPAAPDPPAAPVVKPG